MSAPDRQPPRVLMVIESAFPAPRGGGAEAQVRTLARGLKARGVAVTVLAPMLKRGSRQRVGRVDGVPVVRLRYPRVRFIGGPILWLVLALFLYRRRHRYDAWHVHIAHHMGAVCALMGEWLGKRVVVKVSGWWEMEEGVLAPGAWPLSRLAFRCLLKADAWQAISHRIAANLAARGIPADRILLLPNAVDLGRFRADATQKEETDGTRFVFVGRVVAEKGLPQLIEAFSRIAPLHPGAVLDVVGDGPLLPALQRQVKAMGIHDAVNFLGHSDNVVAILQQADYGVLTSRIEGLSNTLLEYMASGLPVVASRISGNEDFVKHGSNGWLYDAGDVDALTECLRQAAGQGPLERAALGREARQAVAQRAALDLVLDRLLAAYRGPGAPPLGAALPSAGSH